MGPPGPWESISDRLLLLQLLKTDFHSEIGPGGCARAKDMLYDIVQKAQRRENFKNFKFFEPQAAPNVPRLRPPIRDPE